MDNLVNISWEVESDGSKWFAVTINLINDFSYWEVFSTKEKEEEIFNSILKVIPMFFMLDRFGFGVLSGSKVDPDQFSLSHSQINQFVARNKFRNVDKNDFLAQSTILDHKKNLGFDK